MNTDIQMSMSVHTSVLYIMCDIDWWPNVTEVVTHLHKLFICHTLYTTRWLRCSKHHLISEFLSFCAAPNSKSSYKLYVFVDYYFVSTGKIFKQMLSRLNSLRRHVTQELIKNINFEIFSHSRHKLTNMY